MKLGIVLILASSILDFLSPFLPGVTMAFQSFPLFPKLSQALEIQKQMKITSTKITEEVWRISEFACKKLHEWNLPENCLVAALLVPIIREELYSLDKLIHLFGSGPVDLAKKSIFWRSYMNLSDTGALNENLSNRLRWLFREVHLLYPDLCLIFLILAIHDARINLVRSKSVAKESKHIFIPLVEMMGIWSLRRSWLEQYTKILNPGEYKNLIKETGVLTIYSDLEMKRIARYEGESGEKNFAIDVDKSQQIISSRIIDKAKSYTALAEDLSDRFREKKWRYRPRVEPRKLEPGIFFHHDPKGESRQELLNRLSIRIFCLHRSDCYKVLGIVHKLGNPVAPRFSERFDDHIAISQTNGYQCLHTAIMYQGGGRTLLTDVRILTPTMHRMNRKGIIFSIYNKRNRRQSHFPDSAWWNKSKSISNDLHKRFRHIDPDINYQSWIEKNHLNTRSNPIYVFTPKGEVVFLEKNSTTLDFAYHIHTDLGHCASRFTVNGNQESIDYPLRNGDLVYIEYDFRNRGPDLAWLSFAKTQYAKYKIRRELVRQAQELHPGRVSIIEALRRLISYYKDNRGYDVQITTGMMNSFLNRFIEDMGIVNLQHLYDDVKDKRIHAHLVAHKLISSEFIKWLVYQDGRELSMSGYKTLLCDNCRPIPSDPITAIYRRKSKKTTLITIHNSESIQCLGHDAHHRILDIKWLSHQAKIGEQKEIINFQIQGEDRHRLLGEVLDVIYSQEPKIEITNAEAKALLDGSADLSIIISAPNYETIYILKKKLESIVGIRHVVYVPLSISQEFPHLKPEYIPENPYIEREVFNRYNFFDREIETKKILTWLHGKEHSGWLLLHGQRRIGKSSLAKYLSYEILHRSPIARPIYVTLQSLSRFDSQNFSNFIADAVYREIRQEVPVQMTIEEPAMWLKRILEDAVQILGGNQILIIIDEFNVLLEAEARNELDFVLFSNLRALFQENIPVRWMMIVQDNEFQDRKLWGGASAIFQQANTVPLNNLAPGYADKLICEPIKNCNSYFSSERIPKEIYKLSSGNPFIIKLICYQLVEISRKNRQPRISLEDLNYAKNVVLAQGDRYFDHYLRNLNSKKIAILSFLSFRTEKQEWCNISELKTSFCNLSDNTDLDEINRQIASLFRQGIIDIDERNNLIRIRIGLFSLFLQQSSDDLLEGEYRWLKNLQ